MTQILFFTDEDVYGATVIALRNAGFDALATPEAGRTGESDESQLQWASDHARVMVTFNVGHFANLHAQWMNNDQHHAGIIVSIQRPIGDLLRRLLNLANALDAAAMRDRLEFLTDW